MPQRRGIRCYGFLSPDGWAHCTRVESKWPDLGGESWAHPPDAKALGRPVYIAPPEEKRMADRRRASMANVLGESINAAHADAEPMRAYLVGRGLTLAIPESLRFHRGLPYFEGRQQVGTFPAMLGLVVDASGRPVTVHRTFITRDGKKAPVTAPRKMMAPAVPGSTRGCAIRLAEPSQRLALSEGLESGMAFQQSTGWPTWACISAGGLTSVEVPADVEEVAIAADHDDTGLRTARLLAMRLIKGGREVRIVAPPRPGQDWNDVLLEGLA